MNTNKGLPNFVFLGTEKSASTLLFKILSTHPNVSLPKEKETFFFNKKWDLGVDWYAKQFNYKENGHCIGDITPSYFRSPVTLERIHCLLGKNVKVILCLRKPMEFAYSLYVHHLRLGQVDTAFEYMRPKAYYFPDYIKAIENLYRIFEAQNILVLCYEDDVVDNLNKGIKKVCDFLEINTIEVDNRPVNFGAFPHYIYSADQDIEFYSGRQAYLIPKNNLVFCSERKTEKVMNKPSKNQLISAFSRQSIWTRGLKFDTIMDTTLAMYESVVPELQRRFSLDFGHWLEPQSYSDIYYQSARPPKCLKIN